MHNLSHVEHATACIQMNPVIFQLLFWHALNQNQCVPKIKLKQILLTPDILLSTQVS